jgi:hypothetical protein
MGEVDSSVAGPEPESKPELGPLREGGIMMSLQSLQFTFIRMLLGTICCMVVHSPSYSQSDEFRFTKTFIHTLGIKHALEMRAEKEGKEAGDDQSQLLATTMTNAQRGILKMDMAIGLLEPSTRSTNSRVKESARTSLDFYRALKRNFDEFLNLSEEIVTLRDGPKAAKVLRRITELVAKRESIDEDITEVSLLVCFLMVDTIPDSDNRCSYLTISGSERDELLKDLTIQFGTDLLSEDVKNPSYTVAGARILKTLLTGGHKNREERPRGDFSPFNRGTRFNLLGLGAPQKMSLAA